MIFSFREVTNVRHDQISVRAKGLEKISTVLVKWSAKRKSEMEVDKMSLNYVNFVSFVADELFKIFGKFLNNINIFRLQM